MRERRGAAGRGYSVRRNAAKGRKKFLTCLRYMRRSSHYFTRVSEVAKQTPPTRSLSLSFSLPHPVFPISPSCPTSYPPFKRRCIPALYHIHRYHRCYCCCCCTLGCCTRCLPLSRGRGLYFRLTVKVNGATSRGELPRRLTGTPNHNFNAYAYCMYAYLNCRAVYIFEDEKYLNP